MTRRSRCAARRWRALAIAGCALLALVVSPATAQDEAFDYLDPTLDVEERVADLLGRMTLEEKVGQMTLIERGSIDPTDVTRYAIGGVLSGGGGYPPGDNTVAGWAAMVRGYQEAALATRLGIPLLYGVDAVHGHANLAGAVVFPHNVGLGAADDPDLVEAIARATALETLATGIHWNFAPVLAVPRDIRWGRTYEGYGEDPELVTRLALAALRGLQGDDLSAPDTMLATPKHFVADGGTAFGTSPLPGALLDRGDAPFDEATLRSVHLAPYEDAVAAGARSVMVSFSSWSGTPMHAHEYLLRDVLRDELGFDGFVVSDWAGIDDVAPDYDEAVAISIAAGVDMNMVPYDHRRFIDAVVGAVERGDVSLERIDEAVANVLRVKFELGLFERPFGDEALQATVGSVEHRALAREAVAATLVLLKNDDAALPLRSDAEQTVLVVGSAADSVGMQSGGWTIEWQGSTASLTPGTTILEGLRAAFGAATTLLHDPRGRFEGANAAPERAELGIAVVGEAPYAEWFGDDAALELPIEDAIAIERLRARVDTLVVVLVSGRPLVIEAELELADAVVAAWLPGSEGDGVADVLLGVRQPVGTLPYTWPRRADQLPFDLDALPTDGPDAPLFPRGYGLTYGEAADASPSPAAPPIDAAPPTDAALRLVDLADGVPTGSDAFGNGIGFVTWHDGGGTLALSAVAVDPADALALPDQRETESVLVVEHGIATWGGVTHAFADDDMTRWIGRDLSPYEGLRFWFKGAGSGGTVQVDLFDNRNPASTGDSAERWYHRFVDDTTEWRLVEIPFSSFERRVDWQPAGAPNDGLGLDQASGWALGFPPGDGTSVVARVEAYGDGGTTIPAGATVEFAQALVRVDESDSAQLLVVLSAPRDDAVSVRVRVRGEEAMPGRDFVPVDEVVVFAPGTTEAVVGIDTLRNRRHTGDRQAIAVLDDPSGAELGFQAQTVVLIVDADPIDPDLIEDFGDGLGAFVADAGTTADTPELLVGDADARPGQATFEQVLRLTWTDGGGVAARFPGAIDASHAEGIEFWYFGDGSGRTVTVQLSTDRDEDRPWELAWSDEFEGPAGAPPDPSVWTPELGDGSDRGIPGWGNAERQTYTADPANLALDGDGHLVIRALETQGDGPQCSYGSLCEYTSARIVTQGAIEVTYGRIEARIRLPFGQGMWPAFWTLGADIGDVGWPESGEIDVMEHIGREPSQVHGTVHGPGYSGAAGIGRSVELDGDRRFSEDFHVFAVDWAPGRITWYLDGAPYSTLTPSDLPSGARWVFDRPHFLILNLAVGGHWPGYPDETTTFPQEMVVDYVRVYTQSDDSDTFAATYRDDVVGWSLVRLPFDAFEGAATGAADAVGATLDRGRVRGVGIRIDGGPGAAMLDEVRWSVGE